MWFPACDHVTGAGALSSRGASHLLGGVFPWRAAGALDLRRALHRAVPLQDPALAGARRGGAGSRRLLPGRECVAPPTPTPLTCRAWMLGVTVGCGVQVTRDVMRASLAVPPGDSYNVTVTACTERSRNTSAPAAIKLGGPLSCGARSRCTAAHGGRVSRLLQSRRRRGRCTPSTPRTRP